MSKQAADARAPQGAHSLAFWQRAGVYAGGSTLLVTGLSWLVLRYGRAADALPSPLEPWAMRLHGLAGFAALFLFGALTASHIPRGWRFSHRRSWRDQRLSGIALCVLAAALVLTGYLLYYFAPDGIRPALGWLHSALGAAMAALVAGHRRRHDGRDAASKSNPTMPDGAFK